MDRIELFESLGIALGIGLLIGTERGWVSRDEPEGERAFGLRTFALIGLLGGVTGVVARSAAGSEGLLVGLVFAALAPLLAFFRWRELEHESKFGSTTLIATLLAFMLGVMAVLGDRVMAAAAGVGVAGLLALKPVLHAWLRRLTWEELRAGLVLLSMSVILLPVLPRQGPYPFQALDLREIWLLTVLIAALSFAGYVAVKIAGDRVGVLLSGAAGGLTSSTATTVSLMRMARTNPGQAELLAAGAAAAGVIMMLRVLAIAAVLGPDVARLLALPLATGAIAQALCATVFVMRQRRDARTAAGLNLTNPFDLASVMRFGLLLAAITILSRLAADHLGSAGLYALAAISGIADVDALTLSLTRVAGASVAPANAAGAILVAVGVNTAAKAVLGWMAGGAAGGSRLAMAAGAGLIGLAGGYGIASRFSA